MSASSLAGQRHLLLGIMLVNFAHDGAFECHCDGSCYLIFIGSCSLYRGLVVMLQKIKIKKNKKKTYHHPPLHLVINKLLPTHISLSHTHTHTHTYLIHKEKNNFPCHWQSDIFEGRSDGVRNRSRCFVLLGPLLII